MSLDRAHLLCAASGPKAHECLILLLHLDRFDGAGGCIANKSGSLIELSVGRGTGTMNFRAKASAERR
jgi:hypothetical protein